MSRQWPQVILSCEHARNRIPPECRAAFASPAARRDLATHRGWDPGALEAARLLSRRLDAPLLAGGVSRLVIDLNRSPRHPRLFSRWTRPLPPERRAAIRARWWQPYRTELEARVAGATGLRIPVVHLSVHSFTPIWQGRRRRTDVGLLYDPRRAAEKTFSLEWQARLKAAGPWRVRRNHPYRGVADGAVTALRRRFPGSSYLGLEIELNQRFPGGSAAVWRRLRQAVADTFEETLATFPC